MPQRDRQTIAERAKAFLARHGGNAEAAVAAALSDLLSTKKQLRQAQTAESPYKPDARVAELERENERLEGEVDRVSALIPAQGAIVLVGDDAKAYTDYKALGAPADVKKQLDELPTLRTKIADSDLKSVGATAAKLLGWNTDATIAAIADKKLAVTLVDAKDKDGKDIKVPHVRPSADDKAAPVPFTDWVKSNASYLAPSLAAKNDGSTTTTTTTQTSAPFTVQSSASTPPVTGDPVADFQKRAQAERDARPNPLIPRKAAAS